MYQSRIRALFVESDVICFHWFAGSEDVVSGHCWKIHYGTNFESISTMLDIPLQEAPNATPRGF